MTKGVDERIDSHSVGKPWKIWIDRGLDVRQARRMVLDRND